ncbi:hypothetical protein [uncultured Ferrimonas sp.]|uniref:hypothetical protein n=1 Tax=uncultured Ferrimonas sp. TaxID=432640 RepID=UPI002628C2C7|nr:hypothetical protein [uncultured Ferrimonas sp.]
MNDAHQLQQIDAQLAQVLTEIEQASNDDEPPYEALQPLLLERQGCLAQLLQSSLGQDRQWLQHTLQQTQQLTARAVAQLNQSKQRFGGYKKGRQQVNRYQQVEAGRG